MDDPKDRKVHTSAVIIMPPKEQWEQIQAIREKGDKAFQRWMPHINMVYPFVPESEFGNAEKTLTEAFKDFVPFDVSLAAFDFFSHSKTSKTIYLKPDAQGTLAIRRVHAKLEGAFPHCNDLSGKSAMGFQPHLTVSQTNSADACDKAIQSYLKGWRAVKWTVKELYVISRPDEVTPYTIKHTIKLGGNAVAKAEQELEDEDVKVELAPCFYQMAGNDLRLSCTWEEDAYDTAQAQLASKILLVIDISGSMGSDLESVKAAVRYMLNNGITKPDVIVYNTTARQCTAEEMLAMKVDGGTSFEAALNKVVEYAGARRPEEKLAAIFMTDGDDNNSQNLPNAKLAAREFLCTRDVVMHTIGFGKSHCKSLLMELAKLGKREGVYRYAEGKGSLDTKFSELFDFIEMNIKRTLLINGHPMSVDAERGPSGELTVDAFLRLDQVDPERKFFNGRACTINMAEGASVNVQFSEADVFFALKRIEETEVTTQPQLQKLQAQLAEVQIGKVARQQRGKLLENKATVQAKLDLYHAVFAQAARGAVQGDNLAAQLLSLRHETKFANARRARVMAQRAQTNASGMKQIEAKLKLLKPDLDTFKAMDLTCPLSGTTVQEAMGETINDFFCFALRVTRPEHAIEAPTQLSMQKVLVGTYSNDAFLQASKFAVQSVGGAQAHGGFAVPNAGLAAEVGLFKGPDGEKMNACLPLFINDAHWARVQLQIKPILGYFFTLDPLGFRGDQYIALFGILGHMLCLRANGQFVSEWADWLIADFAKLCSAVKPLALHYLKSGGYTGRVRGDLLEDFLASPLNRVKEAIPNLIVVVGWEYGTGVSTAPATSERYFTAFTEELWRRNLGVAYHATPAQMANDTVEKLLLEPLEVDEDESGAPAAAEGESVDRHANKPQREREFEEYAKFKFGKLSKAKQADAAKIWTSKGPEIEGLLPETHGFKSCKLLKYAENAARLDKIVQEELGKIKAQNEYVSALYGQRPLGADFSGKLKALRFHGNSAANSGVASGAYKNTFEFTDDEKLAVLVQDIYDEFERKRKESWTSVVRGRNEVLTARRICATRDAHAFCGRLMLSCPTRGGNVFDAVLALLCTAVIGNERIPLIEQKVRALMVGRVRFSEDVDENVMSNGESYVHCPPETAKRLCEAIGKEAWIRLEAEMYGTWGWVYRQSDMPNRHGYHNSHPNPDLTTTFKGFKF